MHKLKDGHFKDREANKIFQNFVRMAVATKNIKMTASLSPHLIILDVRRIRSMVLICASLSFFKIMNNQAELLN